MALSRPPSAQELQHRVAFDRRLAVDDGRGNIEGRFSEAFTLWAAFRPRGGSEAVVAARLEGRNIIGVYLRSSAQARQIASDWQMRDVRNGQWEGEGADRYWSGPIYAVKIVDAVSDRNWVYLEVQTGVSP